MRRDTTPHPTPHSPHPELRRALDGTYYTRSAFFKWYGTNEVWENAKPVVLAWDGRVSSTAEATSPAARSHPQPSSAGQPACAAPRLSVQSAPCLVTQVSASKFLDTLEEATYKHEANPTQVTLLRELVNSLSSGDLLLMPTDEVWHLDEDQQEEKAIATAQDAAAEITISPLAHLTAQSAAIGLWEVLIFAPETTEREYTYQGSKRTSYIFRCLLVSTKDPTQYVLGESRGKGMTPQVLREMVERFKQGLVFQMTKPSFVSNVKQQYNSAPKSEVISMMHTTFTPVLCSAGKPTMPEPSIPISTCMSIDREQLFDVMGIVREVSELLPGGRTSSGQERVRCTCKIIDGSKMPGTDRTCDLPITIFADKPSNSSVALPAMFQELKEAATNQWAVAIFGIQGKQSTDNGKAAWSFTSSFTFSVVRASKTMKGKQLETEVKRLLEEQSASVPMPATHVSSMDVASFADQLGTETTCALFSTILRRTRLQAIENENTIWQINWCRVYLPEKGVQVTTHDASRLWMRVKVEDETGSFHLYMNEKAALALAGVEDKSAFEAAHAQDILYFPAKASVKILRKGLAFETPNAKATETSNNVAQPDPTCYIVEAMEQPLEDTRSKRSLVLLKLMENTKVNTDVCVPAAASIVHKEPHYGLSVHYVVDRALVKKTCITALVLVEANVASKMERVNEGFMMTTEKVKDALDDTFVFTLISYCSLTNAPDYQLKPTRQKRAQMALVTISDVLETGSAEKPTTFLATSIEKLSENDAETARDHMRRTMFFASLAAKQQGAGPNNVWTEELSPANASKCRRLGKSPTDELLDQYLLSP